MVDFAQVFADMWHDFEQESDVSENTSRFQRNELV